MTSRGFRINAPTVAMQEIEGEAILINLDSGCYYSANPTGTVVLDLAQRGEPVSAIVDALVASADVSSTDATTAVEAFFRDAQANGLVIPVDAAVAPAKPASHPNASSARAAFVQPRLEKFDDLQDLLMLDPIHDVDQAGWPMPAPPEAPPGPGTN